MAIREIPRAFAYTCDRCKLDHLQENASGHYTNSQPPGWGRLRFEASDATCLDEGSIDYLLCRGCCHDVADVLKKSLSRETGSFSIGPW